jgi:hypothetical protein
MKEARITLAQITAALLPYTAEQVPEGWGVCDAAGEHVITVGSLPELAEVAAEIGGTA